VRNISFSLTSPQFLQGRKDVTRRLGWLYLKTGDILMACEKCMGRRPGEPLVRLGPLEVLSVRREPLSDLLKDPAYGREECRREGFPEMSPEEFVAFFCRTHPPCTRDTPVTRIEFRRIQKPV
jgi:hypothetical protein